MIRGVDFAAVCGTLHNISGRMLDAECDPLGGVAVTIRDEFNRWDSTVFADVERLYLIRNVVRGLDCNVRLSYSSYAFDPPVRMYENLDRDYEDQDFIATLVKAHR